MSEQAPAALPLRQRVGLTTRGWSFLVAGAALAAAGLARGLVPAVQFGALVAMLPVAAAVITVGPRSRIDLERSVSARELPSGEELRVIVNVRGRFPRWRSLLLEDVAPPALGGSHRFAVGGMTGRGISRPHYRVRTGARGAHHIGPLRLHLIDRFGMVHRVRTAAVHDLVLVFPPVVPLDAAVLGGASLGTGTGHLGSLGASSDDVIPREYHAGDEVRRIDWKASARTGTLMVRSEESPWRTAVSVVVDVRESAHHGRSPDSSLDAALGVVASVGCAALEAGWDLTVRTTDDVIVFSGSPMAGVEQERRELLRALATVPASSSGIPSPTLRHSADVTSTGPVVMVVGDLDPASAGVLAGVGVHSRQKLLVAVGAPQWQGRGRAPRAQVSRDQAPSAPGGPAATAGFVGSVGHAGSAGSGGSAGSAAHALDHFHAAGWRVAQLGRGEDLRAAWSRLGALP